MEDTKTFEIGIIYALVDKVSKKIVPWPVSVVRSCRMNCFFINILNSYLGLTWDLSMVKHIISLYILFLTSVLIYRKIID